MGKTFAVNLGGEGEVPGIINQQPPAAFGPHWLSQQGLTLAQLIASGLPFLVCANDALPFPEDSVDAVHTNGVPIDCVSTLGLGVQSSEIRRILKSGGVQIEYGVVVFTKP